MSDAGHDLTEDLLSSLEKKIVAVYAQAADEMRRKLEKQLEKYQKKLTVKQAEYDSGKISKKDFDTWKQGQAHMQDNTKVLVDTLTADLVNHNEIATAMINEHTPDVYALNFNFGTYQIEKIIEASTSFSLYNHFTVESLIRDDPQILPEWKIDEKKDYVWNYKKVNLALTQGILQGESIPKIAERFRTGLYARNKNLMITFARTATTGAQSAGRVGAYKRAKGMGISLRQEWLATLDGRTRHEHRVLNGKVADVGGEFEVEGEKIRYPGDPTASPRLVYQCRCTLVPVVKGFEAPGNWENVTDYEKWKGETVKKEDESLKLSEKIKNDIIEKAKNSRFKGVVRDATNGTGAYVWKNSKAIPFDYVRSLNSFSIFERDGKAIVYGLMGQDMVFYANDFDSVEISTLKHILEKRKESAFTQADEIKITPTTTYDRWKKQHDKDFAAWFGKDRLKSKKKN